VNKRELPGQHCTCPRTAIANGRKELNDGDPVPVGVPLQRVLSVHPTTTNSSHQVMDDRPVSEIPGSFGEALHIPLPPSLTDLPRGSYLESDAPSTRDSTVPASLNNNSGPLLSGYPKPESDEFLTEQQPQEDTTKPRRRWPLILLGGVGFVLLVFLAVFLPVYFTVIKHHHRTSTSGGGSSNAPTSTPTPGGGGGGGSNPGANTYTTGGDGSTIVTEDGSTFIYNNKFGGFCKSDPLLSLSLDIPLSTEIVGAKIITSLMSRAGQLAFRISFRT